ncbi:MAG TPA: hypothetical protein VL614_08895 [Acetobacteraceae bacterium]|nr:hypothetical protein [Acetobacteraceae bacterium]
MGLILHAKLPDDHLDGDSKDVVKLVIGLVATMAALVLGLLIASAQSTYATQNSNVQQLAADVAQLDRILELYGQEANQIRTLLRQAVVAAHDMIWTQSGVQSQNLDPMDNRSDANRFIFALESLAPKSDVQHFAKAQALQLSQSIGQIRALMFQQANNGVSWPFLVALSFWLGVLFLGFGLVGRFHTTVAAALLVGSLSVSAAVYLILELGSPYGGLIQLSDAPLRMVLAQMAKAGP